MSESKKLQPLAPSSSSTDIDAPITTQRFTAIQNELIMRSRMQTAVAELGQASLTNVDASMLTAQACALLADTLEVEFCRALEYLPDELQLVLRGVVGWKGSEGAADPLDGEALYTFYAPEPVVFDDLSTERRFSSSVLNAYGVKSGVSVTLKGKDEPFGVLGVFTTQARSFREYEVEFVQSVANVLAAAIESKRTRDELEETRAQIQRREKLAAVGSWVWSRGKREWQWSDEVYRLLDLDRNEVTSDYATFLSRVFPGDRTAFARLIEEAFSKPGDYHLEHRLLTSSGTPRVVRTVVSGVFGHDGKPLRLIGITQDVTSRANAEQDRVRLSAMVEIAAEEWRMTCDALDLVVLMLDRNATILRLNDRARRLLHMTFDDAIGSELPTAASGEPWSTIRQLATAVSETQLPSRADAHDSVRGKQWDVVGRALSHSALADERVVIVASDVTDQVTREKIRREADFVDGLVEFIRLLSERTETPLETLTQLLSQHFASIELANDELRRARAATYDLTALFRELTDYARPFELSPEPRAIAPLLEVAMTDVAASAERHGVSILSEFSTVSPMLANDERLQHLLRESLKLFVDRCDVGTNVFVTLEEMPWRRERWINVLISAPQAIFSRSELQWILDPGLPRLSDDTALRLSIMKRIADEHGGTILLANRRDNTGSFVSLRFPPFRVG
jgi:PAS domain-containing protein